MQPFITIVTIVFRDRKGFEATAQSVVSQSYTHFEWVVVDGGSEDGTKESIEGYADRIGAWVSEPDKGIYDAMNKGIQLAKGEWILFMNAGDIFAYSNAIEDLVDQGMTDADLVYGGHLVQFGEWAKPRPPLPPEHLWKGMVCSHQSLLARAEWLRQMPFRWETFPLIADFDFIFRCWEAGAIFDPRPVEVAHFAPGGLSDRKMLLAKWHTFLRVRQSARMLPVSVFRFYRFYAQLLAFNGVVTLLRIGLPAAWFDRLMRWKNK